MQAQPGTLDLTFNLDDLGLGTGDGPDAGEIRAIALQSDGRVLVGGNFYAFNRHPLRCVARLHSDGRLDPTFMTDSRLNGEVWSMALQPNGRVIVGGQLTLFLGGTPRHGIARLDAFGAVDPAFAAGTGTDGPVYALALQPDGKILIGGYFTQYNGQSRSYFARLNADGSLDAGFQPGAGPDGAVSALALQPDGKILISGQFSHYDGVLRPGLARLHANGSLDMSFEPGQGPDNLVQTIGIQPDGRILIGGWFDTYRNAPRRRIARLNADGSLDATFQPGAGVAGSISAFTLQPDGKICIAGEFSAYDGIARGNMARLNANGSLDQSFNPGIGADAPVFALTLQTSGYLLAVGRFRQFDGVSRSRLARLSPNGALDLKFHAPTAADGTVYAIAVQPSDGNILIGGAFLNYGNHSRRGIARLHVDGTLDASFHPGEGADNHVRALAIQSDGKILVAGHFSRFNGVLRGHLARLNADGSLDATFANGMGADAPIYAMAVQPDGKILIAGAFRSYNGIARNGIARLNADGAVDVSFNPGTGADLPITALALQPDGKIFIGGSFSTYDGISRVRIARLNADGTLDTSFNPGKGVDGPVHALLLQPDGKLLIGGLFGKYDYVLYSNIARVNPNGTYDKDFYPGIAFGVDNAVYALALQSDGKVLLGGTFSRYNNSLRSGIARLNANGTLDTEFDPGLGANDEVWTLTLQADQKILLGGAFTVYHQTGRNRIARLNSGVVSTASLSDALLEVALYPNPTTDRFWLDLSSLAGEEAQLYVYNSSGALVLERRIIVGVDALEEVRLRSAGATKGLYAVSIISPSGVVSKRVVLAGE